MSVSRATLEVRIIPVTLPGDSLEAVKALFREYHAFLGIDLSHQHFDAELAALPGKYAPPSGRLFLMTVNEQPAGCVAFYDFRAAHPDYTEADWRLWQIPQGRVCELKRLYICPSFQGSGLGRRLFEHAIHEAKAAGYDLMLLDSLRRLASAEKLYLASGFTERTPYNTDPQPDVYYMEKWL